MPPVLGTMRRPAAATKRPAAALKRPAAIRQEADSAGRTEPDGPTGPYESGANTRAGRARRQYTWWITMPFPYPETVARLNLRTPDDFDHQSVLSNLP